MHKRVPIILALLIFIFHACSGEKDELELILDSNRYKVEFINYHGNITGQSGRTGDTEILIVEKNSKDIKVTYTYSSMGYDKTIQITRDELIIIEDWLRKATDSHNPDKVYSGFCMGSNEDLEISNNEHSILIKPVKWEFRGGGVLKEIGFSAN